LEDHALDFLISGRDLVAAKSMQRPTPPVVFADPDYDLSPELTEQAAKAVLRGAYKEGAAAASGKSRLGRVTRLPGTAMEAILVRSNLPKTGGAEPLVYTERYALESVAKSLQRPQVALFSTHGFFLADQIVRAADKELAAMGRDEVRSTPLTAVGQPIENPLTRCGLLFAGCNPRNEGQSGGGDDGVLTGMEVVGIDFRGTQLIVLSACESGVGAVNTGEGVAGLRQAFQLAGAQSVLATLWQIPDRDSALIMNDLFANLASGQSQAEALQNAQLKRIAERREKYGAAHPFFWAAWTITGN
jgi:CHAT domain-containing protein